MDADVKRIYDWDPSKVRLLQDEFENIINEIEEVKTIELFFSTPESNEAYLKIHICGGKLINDYLIKMRIPVDYPYSLPYCFELSDNFPKKGMLARERHITQEVSYIPDDISGSFCMISPFRIKAVFGNYPINIYNTLNLLLIPHLENQEYFTKHGRFIGDGQNVYKHGAAGLVQSFSEIFGVEKKEDIFKILLLYKKNKLNWNDPCYCGSGRPIKKCHNAVIFSIQNLIVWSEHIDALILELAFSVFRDLGEKQQMFYPLSNYSVDQKKRLIISKIMHANDQYL